MPRRLPAIVATLLLIAAGVFAALRSGLVPGRGPADAGHGAGAARGDAAAARSTREPVAVVVAAAESRPVERRVRTVGTLHGREELVVGSLVDGRVRRIRHEVGDAVAPGETLLEIDDADFRLAVEEGARALELELARLGLEAVPDASFDKLALPSVERAVVVQKNAADVLERQRGLFAGKTITRDEFERAQVAFDTARLDVKQRLLEADQTLAAVRHRQATLEVARKRLRDTLVVAPETGGDAGPGAPPPPASYTVADRFVAEGEIVRAAPPSRLFRLVVDDVLELRAAVPERYAAQVRPGQQADLAVESLPGRTVTGHVSRVNPTIDTANRTFEVEVRVPNADRLLKPGGFASGSILLGTDADAVTVPEESIVRFAGVTKLFAVADDRAVAVPVEVGVRLGAGPDGRGGRWVEVRGGVAAGTSVVVSGQSQLADGTPVRIRGPVAATAAAAEDAPR
jgi:RND family efflux transporter MFP subunit